MLKWDNRRGNIQVRLVLNVYSVIVHLLCTTECTSVAFYTILLNCCLHWSCALQLFLYFYQVFYVRCNNKFGMQHRQTSEFGFVLAVWRSSGESVVHCCPLQPRQRTTAAVRLPRIYKLNYMRLQSHFYWKNILWFQLLGCQDLLLVLSMIKKTIFRKDQ